LFAIESILVAASFSPIGAAADPSSAQAVAVERQSEAASVDPFASRQTESPLPTHEALQLKTTLL
jgi:hypothetical protein